MYSEILHGSCNSVVLHAADKSFLSFISKYWLRGNDFLTHILKLCQQETSFQGHHLLCVLNFRSFLLATSSRTSSFPSKYRKREDTQLSNRYLVDFHLQWLAITDWERVLLYFACPFHNFLSSASRVPLPLLAKVIMHSHAMLWYSCVCVATIGRIWDWQIALNLQSFHFFVVTSKEYWQDLSHRKFH